MYVLLSAVSVLYSMYAQSTSFYTRIGRYIPIYRSWKFSSAKMYRLQLMDTVMNETTYFPEIISWYCRYPGLLYTWLDMTILAYTIRSNCVFSKIKCFSQIYTCDQFASRMRIVACIWQFVLSELTKVGILAMKTGYNRGILAIIGILAIKSGYQLWSGYWL